MKSIIRTLTLAAAAAMTLIPMASAVANPETARYQGSQEQRTENVQATSDLRTWIVTTEERIAEGRRDKAITAAHADKLKKQVRQVKTGMGRSAKRQGFVSAAELASYNRTLDAINTDLDGRGIPRSYGNDMLIAPDAKDNSGKSK